MNDLIFQRAEQTDSDEILALLRRIAVWLQRKGLDQWKQFLEERKGAVILKRRFQEGEVYKILKDGNLSGVFVIQWDDTFWHPMKKDGLACWIHTMGIDPSIIGKGVGREILAFIEKAAESAGKKYVRLDCNDANGRLCAYYESNGFKKAGTKPWEQWVVRLYEKEL